MKNIIAIIKDRIEECKANGEMFSMPNINEVDIIVNTHPCDGAILYHSEYIIDLGNKGRIVVDYQSKDKCRTFEINPDRSSISVKCSDSQYDFCDAWDENN